MQRRNDQERIANDEIIAEVNSKMKNALFECLHTISDTQIERDESSDDSEEIADNLITSDDDAKDEKEDDAVSERLRTISDTRIERAVSLDDEKDEKLIKSIEVVILTE